MKAMFGGGCFWCTEAVFNQLRGIKSVVSGYSGGTTENPSYEQVSSGKTGHAEVVQIEYDPTVITYQDLLTVFFATHNPTTKNRQGADVGTQYRSVIFTYNEEQKNEAEKMIADINASNSAGAPVVTEVLPAETFYPGESYHQNYYETHKTANYCELVINPKLEKVTEQFAALLKKHE